MVEVRKPKRYLSPEETNKYKNAIYKVRNKALSHVAVWDESQDILKFFIKGYPGSYKEHFGLIKDTFMLRRDALVHNLGVKTSDYLAELMLKARIEKGLSEEEAKRLDKPLSFLKFMLGDTTTPGKKPKKG